MESPMRFVAAILAALLCYSATAWPAATLLPNGESCFQATTGLNGMVGLLGSITGGTGGITGTYGGVALTGGSGSGATANITVSGGAVTAVAILNPGITYVVGDVLSAVSGNIGNVTGFSVPVSSISINSSLAGGTVAFYIPNTSTFKQTWFNADQAPTHQNTNPVQLDANGCAIIYGTGVYRQVLKDSLGNTVWDQITADTSSNNNTFWAGLAAGTANAITVVDPGFNGTDGSIINFTALLTNTGVTTLNPSGFGAIIILKGTTGGPVALIGGEIIQNNPISVVYSASGNSFTLLNPPIQSANGASAPLCGAIGLKIVNGSTPNSIIALTADQVVTQTPTGITLNRSNVSLLTINTTIGNVTPIANGMDGEAPGTSRWLNIWVIDNGAAPAGLISVSATAPTMPSGYNYKCRLGAMRIDGSGNLLRTLQAGNRGRYVVTTATNTAALPIISSGAAGSTTIPTWITESVSTLVPPTASVITSGLVSQNSANIMLAPNNSYGAYSSNTNPPPLVGSTNAASAANYFGDIVLESTNLYYAADGTGAANVAAFALGWVDKVNAN